MDRGDWAFVITIGVMIVFSVAVMAKTKSNADACRARSCPAGLVAEPLGDGCFCFQVAQ